MSHLTQYNKNSIQNHCQSYLKTNKNLNQIITRKQYEQLKKKTKVNSINFDAKSCKASTKSTPLSNKKNHNAIYKIPLQNLQSLDQRMREQLTTFNRKQVSKQNIDTELYVEQKKLFQLDKFVCLDLYCRSFQLVENDMQHRDISWLNLMKR